MSHFKARQPCVLQADEDDELRSVATPMQVQLLCLLAYAHVPALMGRQACVQDRCSTCLPGGPGLQASLSSILSLLHDIPLLHELCDPA